MNEPVHIRLLRDFMDSLPADLGSTRRIELRDSVKRMLDEGWFQAPAPAPEPAAWVPYLSDRADGVAGHYAIARHHPSGYREVWNLRKHCWGAFCDDVLTLEEANSLLRRLVIPTAPAARPVPSPAVHDGKEQP